MKNPARFLLIYLLTSAFLFLSSAAALAFPSSSTNYNLEGEFGIFGGAKSSTNYLLTDTGGGFAPGFGDSTNYRACSGFQCVGAQVPSITFTLSTNSVNLGTLTTGAVNTSNHTATVTTNLGGYTLTVVEDGNLRRGSDDVDDVGDGAVNAGSEEYGLSTSESGQEITQDTDCPNSPFNASGITATPKTVANAVGPTYSSGETTTLCYAASRSGLTAAGNYNQILTYIATGSF
jgi:hypothetical protein